MKKILIVFVCLVSFGVSYRILRESLFDVPRDAPIFGPAPPAAEALDATLPSAPSRELGPIPKTWPWQEKSLRATDLLALAKEARPAADAGDADAQFALFNVFSYCGDAQADARAHCAELIKEYPDCAKQADLWLKKSSDAGFPRAVIRATIEDVRQLVRKPPRKDERQKRLAEARANVLTALKANDPEVTILTPGFLRLFYPDDARVEQAEWVWKLAACEQGLECRPNSPFVLEDCRYRNLCMSGESGQNYVRRVAAEIPSLDSRARDLAKLLRNGAIDDKTFDETVTTLKPPTSDVFAKSRAPRPAN